MMYMGSKRRIVKHIMPIIMENHEDKNYYVEPFLGGGNSIQACTASKRIGADASLYVVQAMRAVQDGLTYKNSEEFTEEDYNRLKPYVRNNLSLPNRDAWAMHVASFGGKLGGGYARGVSDDYIAQGHRNAVKQSPFIQNVELIHADYQNLHIPSNSTIYCDPPYKGTTGYKNELNHDDFFEWCRVKKSEGYTVFISEANAPDDFEAVWELETNTALTNQGNYATGKRKRVERLFIPK